MTSANDLNLSESQLSVSGEIGMIMIPTGQACPKDGVRQHVKSSWHVACTANMCVTNVIFLFVSFPSFLSASAYFFFLETFYVPLKSRLSTMTQSLSIPRFYIRKLLNRKFGGSGGRRHFSSRDPI